mmetsp:Transcript_44830/g.126910  ORF Transcript_44830/g.126910 Transcript_44830/m.126910 type:complete len:408 (+) Transcript_44830:125-1348(+)
MWPGCWTCKGWTLICVACCSSAAAIEAAAAGADAEAAAASSGPDALWHVLPPELQHSLSGVLMRHSESESLDPEVDALLSHLLHDELDSQHQEFIAEEQQASKEAVEMAKAEEEKRRREHERATAHLEEQRRAHEVEREAAKVQREAEQKRAQEEALERHRSHEEMLRKNKEFNQQMQERREKSQQKRAALQEQHAKNWQRATSMLQQVHEQIEIVTDGWREAPFWDDFFRTSSASGRFAQLGFDHLQPVLAAAAMQPQHRLLVLEPRGATLAERLAGEIRSRTAQQAEAQQYGSEGEGWTVKQRHQAKLPSADLPTLNLRGCHVHEQRQSRARGFQAGCFEKRSVPHGKACEAGRHMDQHFGGASSAPCATLGPFGKRHVRTSKRERRRCSRHARDCIASSCSRPK